MRHLRIYISKNGDVNLFDPNLPAENFIKALVPDFETHALQLKGSAPFVQKTRNLEIGLNQHDLERLTLKELKEIHNKALLGQNNMFFATKSITLLDLKAEIAERELKHCQLCGNNCGANRFQHVGKCGLGAEAYYTSAYVHLAEESVINPSLAVNLESCCGLDCCFCQSKGIAKTANLKVNLLNKNLWQIVSAEMKKVATIEFAGGSPDENIYAILEFLKNAPPRIMPIVSNCHLYANEIVYTLWDSVVDVYVADFKFGNDSCAEKLAGASNYVDVAVRGLKSMLSQTFKPKVIVRLLILPTHVECCSLQILRMLAPFKEKILLNVMDQYVPEYMILQGYHSKLNRRVHQDEFQTILSQAREFGFRLT